MKINLGMTNGRTTALYGLSAVGFMCALPFWSWGWHAASVLIHVLVISVFSAVTHRYFCHRAYEANQSAMFWWSVIPTLFGYSTPVGWSYLHTAHHAHADTDKDSHIKGLAGLMTADYRMPPAKYALAARWFHNERHEWLHRHSALLIAAYWIALACISLDALLWLGMVPTFTLHLFNNLHRVFSHGAKGVRNLWALEYIFPMGGEWIHDIHHVEPKRKSFGCRWFELDTGHWIAKLLSR